MGGCKRWKNNRADRGLLTCGWFCVFDRPEAARTNPANKELIDLYEGLTSYVVASNVRYISIVIPIVFFVFISRTKAILDKIFARHNLLPMDPLGEKFDPNYVRCRREGSRTKSIRDARSQPRASLTLPQHQAIFQMPVTDGKKPGTVGAVVKKGYTLNGRTIRAAGVGVIQAEES